jgi:glycosyltransferase involved in cell wall biosynthesis
MADATGAPRQFSVVQQDGPAEAPRIAVLIPCYLEELTIGKVVHQFRRHLPEAEICVFDNNSSDRTADEARSAGARVFHEKRQGKGFVIQSMFRKIEADIYVMVDGDDTYPAEAVRDLVEPIAAGEADMVIGSRLHALSRSEFRTLSRVGNWMYRNLLNWMFDVHLTDLLSGYRAFSARLVRSLALFHGGFETEIEMTVKTLERGFVVIERPVNLRPRPAGSYSKIRTTQDGWLLLRALLSLFRDYRPLTFFGGLGVASMLVSLLPAGWVLADYLNGGYVHRIPSAILAAGLMSLGVLLCCVGLILHTISRRFHELDFHVRALAGRVDGRGK